MTAALGPDAGAVPPAGTLAALIYSKAMTVPKWLYAKKLRLWAARLCGFRFFAFWWFLFRLFVYFFGGLCGAFLFEALHMARSACVCIRDYQKMRGAIVKSRRLGYC